ncbi:DUF4396 domain-containing protein [Jiella sp. M17.18]|uniref:DUF4396 domain-containing protein n=1 Tax=Jiella sp. M17.18 TaxID=3234247 RepID=UPI0034DFC04E
MIPLWLHILAWAMLAVGVISLSIIAIDVTKHPQHMSIMNVVWPVTGLYAGPLALWAYWTYGRLARHEVAHAAMEHDEEMPHKKLTPFPAKVGKGATHCGAGCTLGDIIAEWLVFIVPAVAVWFGYKSIFPDKIFATWIVDYIFAFIIGVGFQYATIVPMRGLSPGKGIIEAVKADALSLTSWQIGMYGFMAIMHFWVFGAILNVKLEVTMIEFWASMQLAMICGFLTAYPVNWWLIKKGIKEKM